MLLLILKYSIVFDLLFGVFLINDMCNVLSKYMDYYFYEKKKNLITESGRLETFKSYPNKYVARELMARTGLYFKKGHKDLVKCIFCGISISGLKENDDVVLKHLTLSPRCPLLTKQITKNIPSDVNKFIDMLKEIKITNNKTIKPNSFIEKSSNVNCNNSNHQLNIYCKICKHEHVLKLSIS